MIKKIKLNKSVKLDFLHIKEGSNSDDNIFSNNQYIPSLSVDSRFLVKFEDTTLIAHGITNLALGNTFSVYKKVNNGLELIYVSRIDDGYLSVTDYKVANNRKYQYYIFKETATAMSQAVLSNDVVIDWYDWSIIDVTPSLTDKNLYYANPSSMWKLTLNLSSDSTTQNMSTTVYQTLAQFPKVSTSNSNYSSGGLSCLLGSVEKVGANTADYNEPFNKIKEWNKFCSNGNLKLLKDRRGNIRLVMITDTSSEIDDIVTQQPTTISFSWVEVEDMDKISVIGV